MEKNHHSQQAVWLVFYKKISSKHTINWKEAVEEALCFGWIDSKKIKIDDERSHQFFSRRKANSTWSKINKDKVEQLIAAGLMEQPGYQTIEVAKQNGSWFILDEVEALVIPQDLEESFAKYPGSKDFFLNLSKTDKKALLYWVVSAKRAETRQKRIVEIAMQAAQQQKPTHLQ